MYWTAGSPDWEEFMDKRTIRHRRQEQQGGMGNTERCFRVSESS